MGKINFSFAAIVIAISVLLGIYMNYRNGMTWNENMANMTGTEKVVTYSLLFVLILIWKNKSLLKKD